MEAILTYIIFLPVLSAFFLGISGASLGWLRVGAIVSSLAVLVLSAIVLNGFDPSGGMQFVRIVPWIQNYGISYYVGVDALSLVFLLLIVLLLPILYIYIWKEQRKGYWYNMMLLQTGVTGAVLSLDVILFYLFWETMLLPIFIMIGRYGSGRFRYNAMKIVLMTILGSMSMFFSILYLGYSFFEATGSWSFAYNDLSGLQLGEQASIWLAAGFLLAFAIKIPLVGFHTWMAPAYASSPTPSVVILSSIMAKLGIYGIWRFGYGLFEGTLLHYAPTIIFFALMGLIFYAIHAMREQNLRRMFAYSSGSHLSLIALGVVLANHYGWGGALYFVATHALSSAGIFLMIGLLYKRTRSIDMSGLGGIAAVAPKFAFFFAFFSLSIAAIPGTGGFVAELMIIIGAFKHSMWIGFVAALTMVSAILYIFRMLQEVIFGSTGANIQNFEDLSVREILMLLPLLLLLLATGVAPSLFMPLIEPQINSSLIWLMQMRGGF
jgi:NADH-quinone oxidoreductase subunit M